jgi:hypothetical protein
MGLMAQKGDAGVGIILGNPTGISAKYWTGENTAIAGSFGYQISQVDHLLLNADFLWHPWSFASEGDLIRIYLGPGAGLGFLSDLSLSIRTTVGASYWFGDLPLEAHVELNPFLQLIGPEDLKGYLGGFLGIRWYFRKFSPNVKISA